MDGLVQRARTATQKTSDRGQISSLFAWRSREREEFEVKDVTEFMTYETKDRGRISSLFAWQSGAREKFEVKDDGEAVAASGGRPEDDP
jgi:hypothetical protein